MFICRVVTMNAIFNLKSKLKNIDEEIIKYESAKQKHRSLDLPKELRAVEMEWEDKEQASFNTFKEVARNVEDTSTFLLKDLLASTASGSITSCKKVPKRCKRKHEKRKPYWSTSPVCPGCLASSEAIEMTGYMVQSLVLQGRLAEAVASVKWLGRQQNSRGGFVSTQDTVVALQALAMYGQAVGRIPQHINVDLKENPRSRRKMSFSVNRSNKLLLQVQVSLPSKPFRNTN